MSIILICIQNNIFSTVTVHEVITRFSKNVPKITIEVVTSENLPERSKLVSGGTAKQEGIEDIDKLRKGTFQNILLKFIKSCTHLLAIFLLIYNKAFLPISYPKKTLIHFRIGKAQRE